MRETKVRSPDVLAAGEELDPARPQHPVEQHVVVVGADRRLVARSCSPAFVTTVVVFFLAEIGDKTQIATIGLAARFEQLYAVVIGTICGMMIADIPAVILGDRLAGRLPLRAIRYTAAFVFAVLGVATLILR